MVYSIPIPKSDCNRFTDIDCDNTNNRFRMTPLNGGYGSYVRWGMNYDDDNHANQMNPNNDEYYHSRGLRIKNDDNHADQMNPNNDEYYHCRE